ncbi:MAG: hypothetical protein M3178_14140 [Pseudomonadota bacterium]|nr:hypothetical protein [Pseudomonadota bacterium]
MMAIFYPEGLEDEPAGDPRAMHGRDALENPAGFLGSAPEKQWVGVLAVEIDHDRKGFMERCRQGVDETF